MDINTLWQAEVSDEGHFGRRTYAAMKNTGLGSGAYAQQASKSDQEVVGS